MSGVEELMDANRISRMTDQELSSNIVRLVSKERHVVVEFLLHLAEIDQRRIHLDLGHDSLFSYLTQRLRFTKAAAYRRSTAARLIARFPMVGEMLRDGRLNLTTLCLLKEVLEDATCRDVLDRAAGRTEAEVEVLVATMRPEPAKPDLIRRLPARPVARQPALSGAGPEPLSAAPMATPPRPARIEPIAEDLRVIRMTVGSEFMAELEQVRDALSREVPSGDLQALLRACFRITLEARARQRRGSEKPAARKPRPTKPGYVPVAVRRAVWDRDEGRCAFVGTDGRRCDSRHQLEFDHVEPKALGGTSTTEGVRLLCRAHNVRAAEQHFGEAHMDGFRPARRSTAQQTSLW